MVVTVTKMKHDVKPSDEPPENVESLPHHLNPSEATDGPGKTSKAYNPKIRWINVIYLGLFHILFIPGLYLACTKALWQTNLFALVVYVVGKTGHGAGPHRLWSHRSFKASAPLRALLITMFTVEGQGTVWAYARDHRIHHKYQETDADPYTVTRGLWYSHVGCHLQTKHPDVLRKRETIDTRDVDSDSIVQFQRRYYWPLSLVLTFFLPTAIPVYFWGESLLVAFFVAVIVRCVFGFHGTWTINSFAHFYGNRPYDKTFWSTNHKIYTYVSLGEGWHNYHHAFPWDYRSSEMGFTSFNITKGFIDLFAKIGWAYDLKTAPLKLIERRALRTGDGTRTASGEPEVWGWNDPDLSGEQRRAATVIATKTTEKLP